MKIRPRGGLWGIILGGVLGSTGELLFLLCSGNYIFFQIWSLGLVFPAMICICCNPGNPGRFWKLYLVCILFTVLLYGMTQGMENLLGIRELPVLLALFAGLLTWIGLREAYTMVQRKRQLVTVTLRHGGQCCQVQGFWDSGNLLREPLGSRPVHIAAPEVLRQLKIPQGKVANVIPYQSLGKSGILPIYQIDEIVTGTGGTRFAPAFLGVADEALMRKKDYQVILNQEAERI